MRIFDRKFKDHKRQFILQAALGGLAVGAALCLFDVVKSPMIVASFGSSAFGAFTMPHRDIFGPRFLIGGYIVGIVAGVIMHKMAVMPMDSVIAQRALYTLAGAFAACLAIFVMGITETEHAPGTSIAIGFALNSWTIMTIILVLAGIIMISVLQRFLKRWMIDLI
ncbi:MAG: HPP family protein [Candidatus Omnitrophota bacterium]